MLAISFPYSSFNIKKEEEKEFILDSIRKKWVRLTPEEWVRQNWIQYLVQVKNYPASLLSVEKEIRLGEVRKRCDIILYKNSLPWLIIECKETGVSLSENTLMQALRYNMKTDCSYLIISNGNHHIGWEIENGSAKEINELPEWT